jgi:hypothetical protein
MASTYSQYKIELVGTGEQAGTWGTTTNNNFGSATPGTYQGFEQAIGGRADVTMSGTTTLSLTNSNAAQDARALYLNLSGTLSGAADLVVPALQKSYLVKNGTTGGFAVTIKVTGQTGVSIPNGKTVWVYNNGTDIVTAVDFIPEIATTTVDATNIEVTNIKAKDGTSAGSIADSTGVVTLASSVLTTTDINGGTIDGAVIGGASADAGSFTTLNTSGQVVFNDAGADVDFRVEGDTDANLLFVDASTDRVGIGTSSPLTNLHVRVNALSGYTSVANSGLLIERGNGPAALNIASPNTESGFIWFADQDSASVGNIAYNHASNFMSFQTNGSERARIDSSGNLGLGTTTAVTKATVYGSGDQKLSLVSPTGSSTQVGINLSPSMTDAEAAANPAQAAIYATDSSYSANIIFANKATGAVGNALTERMRIDSSGNVGIGTTSPVVKLDVNSGTLNVGIIARSTDEGAYISFIDDTTTDENYVVSGAIGNNFVIIAGAAERMRITSAGAITTPGTATGIHDLSGNRNLGAVFRTTNANTSAPAGVEIGFSGATPNNTTQYFLVCYDTTNDKALIYSNGDFQSRTNSYGGISDVKLKQDIVDANSQWDDIKGLRIRKYRFKDEVAVDPDYPSHLGVIAQETELVSPGLVFESPDFENVEVPVLDDEGNPVLNEDGTPQVTKERNALGTTTKGVKYSILYMKAVKALQEAMERIETLEAKVAALEAK